MTKTILVNYLYKKRTELCFFILIDLSYYSVHEKIKIRNVLWFHMRAMKEKCEFKFCTQMLLLLFTFKNILNVF